MNPTWLRMHSRRWTTPLLLLVILAAVFGGAHSAAAQSDPSSPLWPLFLPQVAGGAAQSDVAESNQVVLSAGVGAGICSNDKTTACSINANCGAGNTCLLPTSGGQTQSDQVCMATASGFTPPLNCTANDVSVAQTTSLNVVDDCAFPGDTATISFVAQFVSTATSRYDVGVWVAQDGGNAQTGTCSVSNFPASPTPPWINLEAGNQPTDICGDITKNGSPIYSSIQSIKVTCNDTNGDGNLDINTCLSWDNSPNNTTCTQPIQSKPGTTSKCYCQALPGIAISVPGVIKVDKVTDPAGDPTSFNFTLNKPGGGTTAFSLTDAQAPFNSGALPLGHILGSRDRAGRLAADRLSVHERPGRPYADTGQHRAA